MIQSEGLSIAHSFKERLAKEGIPVKQVMLYGSHAKGTSREDSDIDIAVVCLPFKKTRGEEMDDLFWLGSRVDLRIEPICFHPEDLDEKYSTIVQEVKRTGIPV